MKKIISLILVVMMALSTVTLVSADQESIMDIVVEKLATYTTEKRSALFAYFRPFITTDAGVDAGNSNSSALYRRALYRASESPKRAV